MWLFSSLSLIAIKARLRTRASSVLIDFLATHRKYLVAHEAEGGIWEYTAANAEDPKKGIYLSTHQIFSNHALQVAIYLYNGLNEHKRCTRVSHCLHLNFSHKANGSYLLDRDKARITFNLPVGEAKALYAFALGLVDHFHYRVVRPGRAPKTLAGHVAYDGGERRVILSAVSFDDGSRNGISLDLSSSAAVMLATHALGYGQLLFPQLSDVAVQNMFSTVPQGVRACAEGHDAPVQASLESTASLERPDGPSPDPSFRACAEKPAHGEQRSRLEKTVWAIGNQKWPDMRIDALKRIQSLVDLAQMQQLVQDAGDFRGWDKFLG
jgi:hypothetical protein